MWTLSGERVLWLGEIQSLSMYVGLYAPQKVSELFHREKLKIAPTRMFYFMFLKIYTYRPVAVYFPFFEKFFLLWAGPILHYMVIHSLAADGVLEASPCLV